MISCLLSPLSKPFSTCCCNYGFSELGFGKAKQSVGISQIWDMRPFAWCNPAYWRFRTLFQLLRKSNAQAKNGLTTDSIEWVGKKWKKSDTQEENFTILHHSGGVRFAKLFWNHFESRFVIGITFKRVKAQKIESRLQTLTPCLQSHPISFCFTNESCRVKQ